MNPGIYMDMPADEYHADPCNEPSLSASIAKVLIEKSPFHAWHQHPRLNSSFERQEESKFDLGKALHSLFLEGENVVEHVEVNSWSTSASKKRRDEIRESGRIPLKTPDHTKLMQAYERLSERVKSLDENPLPFQEGHPEVTLVWQELNGIWCRARLDWLHDSRRFIDDLKTSDRSVHPGSAPQQFGRQVFNLHYDLQAAFYLRGIEQLFGNDATFRFVAFELEEPWAISLTSLSPSGLRTGQAKVAHAIETWASCLKSDKWPGYPTHRVEIETPSYEIARWEQEDNGTWL